MDDLLKFESLLQAFCKQHNIGMLSLDARMQYSIFIDKYEIKCHLFEGRIVLKVNLLSNQIEPSSKPDLYKKLLQTSLVHGKDSGATLSLTPEHQILLSRQLSILDCQLYEFEECIEELVDITDSLQPLIDEQAGRKLPLPLIQSDTQGDV